MAFLMNDDRIVSSKAEARAITERYVTSFEMALARAYQRQDTEEIVRVERLLQGARRDLTLYGDTADRVQCPECGRLGQVQPPAAYIAPDQQCAACPGCGHIFRVAPNRC